MSRAIIKDDRIVKLTVNRYIGVDIGTLPKGVGLERLRWTGEELIDLYDLDTIYVNPINLTLHATHLDNTQPVKMKYKDRNKLVKDNKTNKLRVKTQTEIDQPKLDEYRNRRRPEYPSMNDQLGAIIKYLKTKDDLPYELEQIIKSIDSTKKRWPKT